MTARIAAALLLLAGCGGGAAAPPAPSPAAAPAPGSPTAPERPNKATLEAATEIMRLEEAWGRALSARDTAFFHRTLGDDFVGTGGAEVRTKAMVIAELARDSGAVPVPRLEQTQVRIYDDVAVVTGIARYEGAPGRPPARTRYTEIWVRRAGAWQAVHGHYNGIQSEAP